ncbi:diaminopimelate epimerase [Streptomyces aidingensis]|uniref:Diaminopimelate epimerase n=1 Tax=Streptomyces aidingensis TaxID=910347 RepID=A0A1I1U121_9ACTN|nr:diaminopimelate epimerase [Streptomyces aidingensis]SFD64459.1 diaminopimelate epimerase [Streptomyces aidingensis]
MPSRPVPFLKGHGTENDFVILPDPLGGLRLSAATVARLCDRRAGLGGDGLLRVVRCDAIPEGRALAGRAEWFMDYRNADGSLAEMCGNGIRVFARYLERAALIRPEDGEVPIGTRAGIRHVRLTGTGSGDGADGGDGGAVTVAMGAARLPSGPGESVTVTIGDRRWPARHVDMGNPHAVAFVADLAEAGPLLEPPAVTPAAAYPHGTNVEFVTRRGPGHIALRVHERGSGETRSCGTGACAAMVAAARRDGRDPAADGTSVHYTVDVPGGRLEISEHPDGAVEMTGPAVIVAEGILDPAWLGPAE